MTEDAQVNSVLEAMQRYEAQWDAQFAVGDATGTFLYECVLREKPENILELGTWRGASAIYMAAAFKKLGKGKIVTVDLGNDRVEQAAENIAQARVERYIDRVVSDIEKYLPSDQRVYDLIFMDAIKKHQGKWLREILEKNVKKGTKIIIDDVVLMADRMQDLLSFVAANKKLESHTEKIDDGLLIINVLEV